MSLNDDDDDDGGWIVSVSVTTWGGKVKQSNNATTRLL